MALRNILEEPNEALRKVSREVKEVTPHIIKLLDDMAETMDAAEGVGLAAPQVGVLRRVVVIRPEGELIELINPVIVLEEGEQIGREACLSVPDRCGIVTRPMRVVCEALDREGKLRRVEQIGLGARAICHEVAHLDGQLFIDVMEREIFDEEEPVDEE